MSNMPDGAWGSTFDNVDPDWQPRKAWAMRCASGVLHAEHGEVLTAEDALDTLGAAEFMDEAREALQEDEISFDDLTVVSVENERVEDETQREVYEVRAYSVGD
jgi:hypothetical protein